MLIELRFENYRSLRDEVVLTLEEGAIGRGSDKNKKTDLRPRHVKRHKKGILPAVVIYGANASGKSNFLSAFATMCEAVRFSHTRWEPDSGFSRVAFAHEDFESLSSMFEVELVIDTTKYQYGFTADDEQVLEEWLFAWPKGRKQTWFERSKETFKFGEKLDGPNESIREVTRSNSLFLSAAAQNKHPQLAQLYSWFRSATFQHVRTTTNRLRYPWIYRGFLGYRNNSSKVPDYHQKLVSLLKQADLGVVDVELKEIEMESEDEDKYTIRKYFLRHGERNGFSLPIEEESDGTQALFRLAPSLFDVLENGGVLVVDELESSLHPLLAMKVLKLFNSPKTNPKNAQLIFTTHDTNLLGNTLGESPLRRDQIWFAEKNPEGATELYPLTDYKPRKAENLERGYLQGRYGAIPYLGDFVETKE